MESTSVDQIRAEVQDWWGREGVIVQFSNGLWMKVKGRWWFQAGYNNGMQGTAVKQRQQKQDRRGKLSDRLGLVEQRVAVVGWPQLSTV